MTRGSSIILKIGITLILIVAFLLVVWEISVYFQPSLPSDQSSLLSLFGLILVGVLTGLGSLSEIYNLADAIYHGLSVLLLRGKIGIEPYDAATIAASIRYYVRPKCSNLDPAQEVEIRHALIATQESLFVRVNYFLDEDVAHRHLLILADSGMGKTSFAINYFAYNEKRFRKKHRLVLVPLGAKDADDLIAKIANPQDTVIILDALDEDIKAIADHRVRVRDLMAACSSFKKVIMSCRTQFFPKDEEIPVETGLARLGPRSAGEKGVYEFSKLYLSPFTDKDVRAYIDRRFPIWNILSLRSSFRARAIALRIPLLTARPMLLSHIPEVVRTRIDIDYSYQLYEIMIDAWLERESFWADKKDLRDFSERLAVDIYLNREVRGMERVPYDYLSTFAKGCGINLDGWQVRGHSLLNRDAEANFKFAHRSIMEYLFIYRLVDGDRSCQGIRLTDQMKSFLTEILFGSAQQPKSEFVDHYLALTPRAMRHALVHIFDGVELTARPNSGETATQPTLVRESAAYLQNVDDSRLWISKWRIVLAAIFGRHGWPDFVDPSDDPMMQLDVVMKTFNSTIQNGRDAPKKTEYAEVRESRLIIRNMQEVFIVRSSDGWGEGDDWERLLVDLSLRFTRLSKALLRIEQFVEDKDAFDELMDQLQDCITVLSPSSLVAGNLLHFLKIFGFEKMNFIWLVNTSQKIQIVPLLPNFEEFVLLLPTAFIKERNMDNLVPTGLPNLE